MLYRKNSICTYVFLMIMIGVLIHPVAAVAQAPSGDRAVEISKRARDSVNRSGQQLVSSSKAFFKAFDRLTVVFGISTRTHGAFQIADIGQFPVNFIFGYKVKHYSTIAAPKLDNYDSMLNDTH